MLNKSGMFAAAYVKQRRISNICTGMDVILLRGLKDWRNEVNGIEQQIGSIGYNSFVFGKSELSFLQRRSRKLRRTWQGFSSALLDCFDKKINNAFKIEGLS